MDKPSKVCVITGGTSGIGLETAKIYLTNGYRTIICSNDRESVVESAVQKLSCPDMVFFHRVDITDPDQCSTLINGVMGSFGRLDALVNVAGVNENHEFLEGLLDETKRVININLVGTFNMCIAAACAMTAQRFGTIINVSSVCSFIADNTKVGYHASKAGISRFTQVFAHELAPYHVRCVSVAPGWVNTRMMPQDEAIFAIGAKLHMHGRILLPNEVAQILYFLSQDGAYAINGTQVYADDGYSGYKMLEELRSNE